MELQIKCLQIDLARQKESVEYVKEYANLAKEWGYNYILLYLENAVRTKDTEFFSHDDTYSMEEMQEIVEYIEGIGLEIIPAFENLGHLEKFLAYDQLKHLAELNKDTKGRGLYGMPQGQDGCISNPELLKFFDKYVSEVAKLFHGKYIHMGLDEPFDLAVCPRCQERIKAGESKAEMFRKHIIHTNDFVKGLGKTMMMWDDFFQYADIAEELPRDIVLCTWNYTFMNEEPNGLWVDRIKKDWFSYYDRLGFKYLYCVKSYRGSPTCNIETFTEYAKKYHPIGAINTAWCRSNCFYIDSYPFMNYTAKILNGEMDYKESLKLDESAPKVKLYAQMLNCSEECAKAILTEGLGYIGNVTTFDYVEGDTAVKRAHRACLKTVVETIKKELREPTDLASEMLMDIYYSKLSSYNTYRLAKIIDCKFHSYQTGEDLRGYISDVDEIIAQKNQMKAFYAKLWEKYRPNIKSANDDFARAYNGNVDTLEKMKEQLKTSDKKGVFFLEYMMHEGYQTSRTRVIVKYQGESEEKAIYDGGLKPALAGSDVGGIFTFKIATENKKIEYAKIAVYGEGFNCPTRIRYYADGEKYTASQVEKISGEVKDEQKVLTDGSEYATLGIANGVRHFNDHQLAKQIHEIKIEFKRI